MPRKKKIEINGEEVKINEAHILEFQRKVERLKREGINYMDAIVEVCEQDNIDIESIPNLISEALYNRIANEAEQNNLIDDSDGGESLLSFQDE